jgi:hypothetical protein
MLISSHPNSRLVTFYEAILFVGLLGVLTQLRLPFVSLHTGNKS